VIKAVIFDFGGVLMRTGDPAGRREWEARLGLPQGALERIVHGSAAWIKAQRGLISVDDYWAETARVLQLSASDLTALQADYFRDDHLDLDLVALVGSLREAGYRVGLLSNDTLTLEHKLRYDLALYDVFDAVIISAAIGVMKPDPGAYRAVARALGVECGECLFIDDSPANVNGARCVGMQAIHYRAGMDLRAALAPMIDASAKEGKSDGIDP
jgi:putative hydrolase of the HAD superfamily